MADTLQAVCARLYEPTGLVGSKVLALTHPDRPPVRGTITEALDSVIGNDLVLCQLVRVEYEAGGFAWYQLLGIYSQVIGEVFWDLDQLPVAAPNPWRSTRSEREQGFAMRGGVNMGDGRWRGYGGVTTMFDRKLDR